MTQVAPFRSPAVTPIVRQKHAGEVVRWLIAPVVAHRRALLALNVLYFGVAGVAAVYAFINPTVQVELTKLAGEAFSPTGTLGPLIQAYVAGDLLGAIALTFLVNLFLGSAVVLTLPSAVVPFAGVLIGVYRAVLWGLLFAPTDASPLGATLWLHVPTILIEGEAYVVAMLGVWLWWRPVFDRSAERWRAWRSGLLFQVRIYATVAALLVLAAIYEGIEVIWVLSRLTPLT